MNRPRVYISAPITLGDRLQNFCQADEAHRELIQAGFAPINPVLTMGCGHEDEISWDEWLDVDRPWVECSHALLRLPGESAGADEEVAHANKLGVPVYREITDLIADRDKLVDAPRDPVPPPDCDGFADSGSRSRFATGAVRDAEANKGRYDLLPPDAVHQLARVFQVGSQKYGDRNWEEGIPLRRYFDSAFRHLFKSLAGRMDEPHLPMAAWNLLCAIQTEIWIREGHLPTCLREGFPADLQLLDDKKGD